MDLSQGGTRVRTDVGGAADFRDCGYQGKKRAPVFAAHQKCHDVPFLPISSLRVQIRTHVPDAKCFCADNERGYTASKRVKEG